jgi:hypothetical protein
MCLEVEVKKQQQNVHFKSGTGIPGETCLSCENFFAYATSGKLGLGYRSGGELLIH